MRTEDHPLDYAEFEGTIPKGEYGGGTVMLWDRGTWAPIAGKSAKDLDEGHLHFTLDGERMKGEWLLVRMKPRPGEKRENWLLRKIDDEYAEAGDPLVERELTSVLTGRSMAEIAATRTANTRWRARKARPSPPRWRSGRSTMRPRQPRRSPRRASAAEAAAVSARRSSRRWSMPCRPATAGCTRSSSTAIAR